jgi:hypothetical protein
MAIQNSGIFAAGIDSGITGSGKRASYAMLSSNRSSTFHGFAWYGPNMNSVFNVGYEAALGDRGPSHITQIQDSTHQKGAGQTFNPGMQGYYSQTTPSSTSGPWMSGTASSGEFGNACIDCYSDGTFNSVYNRNNNTAYVKHYLNGSAINSDHANKRIVYLLRDGAIRAVDRLYGTHDYSGPGMTDFAVPSLNSSMQGSASYHKARKELTIISYVSSSGSYNCFTYSNVDFDTYPNPFVALNRPEVTRVDATLSLATNWGVNNNESYYNLKPITTDNGNVYVTVFFTSSNFTLYRFTRSGTSAITGTYITALSVTTSYGIDQDQYYGQRMITSRDGTSVATFCPYYYYACGIKCFMIDKTNNTYTSYSQNGTTYGLICLPYGDSSWLFWYNGNNYASNYSGGSAAAQYIKQSTGGFITQNGCYYVPYHTGPNTTNYPGMTQVVDYMLLPSHMLGAKNT